MKMNRLLFGLTALTGLLVIVGRHPVAPKAPLSNAVILIIRHAEKPEEGRGLTAIGEQRARAYVGYFQNFTIDGHPLHIDHLFATADSKGSMRPRLTITPLSQALNMPIDDRFKDSKVDRLAETIENEIYGKEILICWHHGEIADLVAALGGDPNSLLPGGHWPGSVFGWVLELRYDQNGHLVDAKRINEHLLPDDEGQ